MKKRILVMLMAGVFACAALSGCGDDSDDSGSRTKAEADDDDEKEEKEKEKKKPKEEEEEIEEDEEDYDEEEYDDTDYRGVFTGYWYALEGDDLIYIDFNSDRWTLYDMPEEGDGEVLGSGDYACTQDTLYLYMDDGELVATFETEGDGIMTDTESGDVFVYRMDGADSRGQVEELDSYNLETGVDQFIGQWNAQGTDLVFYIYEEYVWAMYNTDGEFQNVKGEYTYDEDKDIITLYADEEIGSMSHTINDTLVDEANGDVFVRWNGNW